MSVSDQQGNYFVSYFQGGHVSALFAEIGPSSIAGPATTAGARATNRCGCLEAAVDSKGNVLAIDPGNGAYRYETKDSGRTNRPWPEQFKYTKSQDFGHVLGFKTDNASWRKSLATRSVLRVRDQ